MKAVVFHPEAGQEVYDAADYYDSIRIRLGNDFLAELRAAVTRIQQNPQAYAVHSGTIRVCSLHRFPFSIYYEELPDRIWIAAVGHHSRRPNYWANRRRTT